MKQNQIYTFSKRRKKTFFPLSFALSVSLFLTGCGTTDTTKLPSATPTPVITESTLSGTNPLPNDQNKP